MIYIIKTSSAPPDLCSPSPMATLEIQAPGPTTKLSNRPETIADNSVDEDHELISPVEEVQLTVTNTDDPTLPVWTFRMWSLGLLSCGLLSFLNQFFAYRKEPLVITQITVLVSTLPIGRFMAATLPTTQFRIPGFGSRLFSLNPGPFNMKEHVLISIFANAGTAFGNGPAYSVHIVDIIIAFYRRKISFLAGWLLIITTQVTWYIARWLISWSIIIFTRPTPCQSLTQWYLTSIYVIKKIDIISYNIIKLHHFISLFV